MNPNTVETTVASKFGGDKNLLVKRTLRQLEIAIGKRVNQQIRFKIIQTIYPEWFHVVNKSLLTKGVEDGAKPSTANWTYNMKTAITKFAEKLEEEGNQDEADIVNGATVWGPIQCRIVGQFLLSIILESSCVKDSEDGEPYKLFDIIKKVIKNRNADTVVLTDKGKSKEASIRHIIAAHSHDLLPMLVPPVEVSNDCGGGWLTDILQEPQSLSKGHIELSQKHLDFINRQAKVGFQINPFIHRLMKVLADMDLTLGKFSVEKPIELPSVNQMLGYGHITDYDEQTRLVRAHPDYKKVKQEHSRMDSRNRRIAQKALLALKINSKIDKIVGDPECFIPMSHDFRGRVYPRVPFISYQSADPGRYLMRFSEKTPIDDKTIHWLQIGIANALGADKLTWAKRLAFFDKHKEEILNVGNMFTTGDFSRAYDFLTNEFVEDPFCVAALADEYTRIVQQGQQYTQVYVIVDTSCSGTSIFNAWRKNLSGAVTSNLVGESSMEDTYLAVWGEIKKLLPLNSVRKVIINKLESSKLLRKMMKQVYVPASYASPITEQKYKLKLYNEDVLKPAGLGLKDKELQAIQSVWEEALNNVASISSVVDWFREMTTLALDLGKTEIKYTTPNGSLMTLRYPKLKIKRIRTFHYGSANLRRIGEYEETPEVNRKKLLDAVTACITHSTDAAILCEALHDYNVPWIGIHDAVGLPPGKLLCDGIKRLKEAFITCAYDYDVWTQFRKDNDIPINEVTAGKVVGDLTDTDMIRKSQYLFS
jgi:DNA-directed RNA polymerase